MPVETIAQSASILARRAGLCKHDQIHCGRRRGMSECLTRDSLESVPVHRPAGGFSGNREPESGVVLVVRTGQHGEKPISGSFGSRHHAAELR